MSCCASSDVRTASHQEAASLLVPGRVARWRFVAVSAGLFVVSSAATIAWCGSAVTTCGCGLDATGCPLATSMWRPSPGRDWPGVALEFLGMWSVMMTAMMLPSLAPRLWRYRQAIAERVVAGASPDRLTALAGAGYLTVWILAGVLVFPLGAALSLAVRDLPSLAAALPIAVGVIVVLASAWQLTTWKARHLACCRGMPAAGPTGDARTAWRHGLHLGRHCVRCCAALTIMLLAIGMMDLTAMALVTAAITLERLLPAGDRVARAIGIVAIIAGVGMMVRALA